VSSFDNSLLSQEFVHLGPKVLEQRSRVFEPIRPDGLQPMLVIKRASALATRPARLRDRMSVVKSNQAAAVGTVQCQRILQPMRPLGCRSYTVDGKPNPVSALCVNYEYLAVEIQEHLCARISILATHRHKVIIY
jgi:hypothetical protein